MANFNPSDPAALGNEWLAAIEGSEGLGPGVDVFYQRLASLGAETIANLRARVLSASTTAPLYVVCDIIPAGAERPSPGVQTAYLMPKSDAANPASPEGWVNSALNTTALWSYIDDDPPVLPWDNTQGHIRVRSTITDNPVYRATLEDAPIPSTARIIGVSIVGVDSVTGPALASTFVGYSLYNGTTEYAPPNNIFGTHVFGNLRVLPCGAINPVTRRPWTPNDIAAFDGGGWTIAVQGSIAAGGDARTTVWSLALKVDYIAVDNRAAYALWERPDGNVTGDIDLAVRTANAAGAAHWSKPGVGNTYTYLFRSEFAPMLYGTTPITGDVRLRTLAQDLGPLALPSGPQPPPPASMRSGRVGIDGNGIPTADLAAAGTAAGALSLRTSAPATSNDSQPYHLTATDVLACTSSATVDQRLRTSVTGNYIAFRAIVFPPASGGGPLTVSVINVGTGLPVGGTFTISADDARALPVIPGGGRYLEGVLSSAASLTSGQPYDLRFSTTTSTAWLFPAPRTHSGAGSASYGGTLDTARLAGVAQTEQDLLATLLIQPTTPANVRASVLAETLPASALCGVDYRRSALIEWDAYTGLGAAFDHFEVQRLVDDGRNLWETIRRVTPESTTSCVDHEPPRGVPVKYQVRAVATTAAFSAWGGSQFVTVHADRHEVVLTSNARPDLSLVYNTEPGARFQFLDQDGDEFVRVTDREMQLVFRDPVPKGTARTITLTVNFGAQPVDGAGRPLGGEQVFAPLLALVNAQGIDMPYVAVCDYRGNVIYGYLSLGDGTEAQPGWVYSVPVTIIPVSSTPVVIED